ncbi:MAG TPA: DUF559 domain-containing protein [Rudaea sp.]|jgi:very-short-patch-repair endonuclease|uniref:endonuclease domain-containing protein n=1 Tax=Rudaea sp. TaxID=2136325 RepID=UPI002F953270
MESRQGTQPARRLRTASTDAEAMLWRHLRNRLLLGYKFRRQFPIFGYTVDFVCIEAGLVIEVDGGQHGDRVEYDRHRTEILIKNGFHVLRFWNNDVLQRTDDVLTEILRHLQTPPSPQPLSRQRERG